MLRMTIADLQNEKVASSAKPTIVADPSTDKSSEKSGDRRKCSGRCSLSIMFDFIPCSTTDFAQLDLSQRMS